MQSERISAVFRASVTIVVAFALLTAFFAGGASAEPVDLSPFSLTAIDGGETVNLGELSKGLPLYIVFATPS